MTISRQEIQKIAHLSKLKLDEASINDLAAQIDTIILLIDQMAQADTDNVEALSHPQDPHLRLRDDVVLEKDARDAFMKLTPYSEDGLYLVPKVIE